MRTPALIGTLIAGCLPAVVSASPDVAAVLHGPGVAPIGTVAVIDGGIAPAAAQAAGVTLTQRVRRGGRSSAPVRAHARGVAEALGQMCAGCRVIDVAIMRTTGGEVSARDADLVAGIDAAVRRGARTIVISMGYEGRCSPAVARAIRTAGRRALIIAAAGNDAMARALPCPARLPGVIAVGGLGDDAQPAPYASARTRPALWALGEVSGAQGSSFAAPRVAGVAASLPGSPAARRSALMSAAITITGRRMLRAPGDVTSRAVVTHGGLIAMVAPGQGMSACVSPGAPDPRLWSAHGAMMLAPGTVTHVASTRWEVLRISGDPGVRVGPCANVTP